MNEHVKYALLSVFDKNGIGDFAQGLVDLGFLLISSGGTAKHLAEKGFSVTDVAEITGYPAIIGHRVVTLHPAIHGGILALNTPEHQADLDHYQINRINLVCVDLYPVADAIAKENATIASVMEMTDIGGPTLLRGAAKNHEQTIVVCDPVDRRWVVEEIRRNGDLNSRQRQGLAKKVFSLTSAYDTVIYQFLEKNCA